MAEIVTIPKTLIKRGELVLMPRSEYEEMLRVNKRLLGEEQDTDEAINIFEAEQKAGKLKKAYSFSEILGIGRARR